MTEPSHVDSAGIPMAGRALSDNPFADDDGSADPLLRSALDAVGGPQHASVMAALHGGRLLVPVVALPSEPGGPGAESTEMAAAILQGTDGRRGLAAFTSVDAVQLWDAEARPVPVAVDAAAQAALDEADLLVIDPAGPVVYPVAGGRLRALAAGRRWRPVHVDPQVKERVDAILGGGGAQSWQLQPPMDPRVNDARLELVLTPDVPPEPLVRRLAADEVLRDRLELGLELAVRHASQFRP